MSDVAASPEALDLDLVTEWMGELGFSGTFAITPLGAGRSNLTYLLQEADGRRWVVRRPPPGPLLPSAHDVEREHRILRALRHTSAPAPRALALREPDGRLAVPLLLMEHVDGHVIDSEEALEQVPLTARRATGLSLARTLARIHEVDLEAAGLERLGSHGPYAERQLRRWSRQYEASRTRDLPLVEQLAARLVRAIPAQHEVRLVHGDFHLLNVIVDPLHGSVRAVLDWELSTLGDPLADLGGLLAYWPEATDAVPAVPHRFPASEGFPSRAELVEAYAQAAGRVTDAIGFWETLGCWKVAIISEGVLRRALEASSGAAAEAAARTSELMLARAAEAADRARI